MQTSILKSTTTVWALVVVASASVLVASILGPRPAFATLCHQLPIRSFIVGDHLFAVCHRCTGIYSGIFLGLLIVALPSVRSVGSHFGIGLLFGALALVAVDVGLDLAGLLNNTSASRVLTGFALGLSGGTFLGSCLPAPSARTVGGSPDCPAISTTPLPENS